MMVVGFVGLIVLLSAASYAYASEFPLLSKFCEFKNGDIKSVGSGFSILKKCPANSRAVLIGGESGPVGPTGPQGPQGPKGDTGSFLSTNLYTKIDGPFNVTVNIASTASHGCNVGDLPMGGGLYSPSGNLMNWRTIKSTPRFTEPSDVAVTMNGWDTTVINTVENGTYFTLTRCYDLQ